MNKLDEIKLGDIARGLRRYQPFIALALAIVLVMVLLPGRTTTTADEAADLEAFGGGTNRRGGERAAGEDGDGFAGGDGLGEDGEFAGGASGLEGGGPGGRTGTGPGGRAVGGSSGPLAVPENVGSDCDSATGRIMVPTNYAPPCTPSFSGNNGGATNQGVSATEIIVVNYDARSNPATEAALTAAGANDSDEDVTATTKAYFDYFNKHYALYGRQVKYVEYDGTGPSDDDAAARADAIEIATRIKPFIVYGSNNNAFVSELAARKILCVCTVSQPQEVYEKHSPYVGYTTLMSSTQGYIHRAEYIGKRIAHKPAKWAGTSDGLPMATKQRVFGLLYFETSDNVYKSGVDFFERELAKYNVKLKVRLAYTGPPNLAATQEQARPFIAKMKENGVTSVVFSGDPISPAIFTSEATRQNYFPEWIITGSALTDTTIFARTYDRRQWSRAFGISYLAARVPQEFGDAYRLHVWHHGREPQAENAYGVIYASPFAIFTGLHMAGPKLTTINWVKGIFSYPPTGGFLTSAHSSWGKHGIWPFTDYTQYDDATEIWWDSAATGPDETGTNGVGMYRYVDGGRRYLPGQHPSTDPKAFDPAGTVLIYDQPPASDKPPQYKHEKH